MALYKFRIIIIIIIIIIINPPNRSSQKLAGVITSWMAPGVQSFVAIGSGVSAPQIHDFAVLLG